MGKVVVLDHPLIKHKTHIRKGQEYRTQGV